MQQKEADPREAFAGIRLFIKFIDVVELASNHVKHLMSLCILSYIILQSLFELNQPIKCKNYQSLSVEKNFSKQVE